MYVFLYLISICFGEPWSVIYPKGVYHNYPQQIHPQKWLVEQNKAFAIPPQTNISKFIVQCIHTRDFLLRNPNAPLGMLSQWGYTNKHRINALTKIIDTATQNKKLLHDPLWWHKHFRHFILHDHSKKSKPSSIRLTKYVVYQVQGSPKKTKTHTQALWAVKNDTSDNILHQFSRIDILNGILEKQQHTDPLVWLTKNDALEAQMQGTIEVELPNKSKRLFNVHRHNNMPYQKGISSENQLRYWYFREVHTIYGWGKTTKVSIQKDVSFAGDVDNLGFGSLIWISKEDHSSLGLIVDTGGAFKPNLGQLDWFIGTVRDKKDFIQKSKAYPARAQVGFLILRDP
ncbi:MAG: hypothetical protein CL916_06840 [Deltaproteobacteria bacterium]|nr:hypothetical protein [Deltaproteobacteria bacterium]